MTPLPAKSRTSPLATEGSSNPEGLRVRGQLILKIMLARRNNLVQACGVQNGLITELDSQVSFARSGQVSRCLRVPLAGLSAGRTLMNKRWRYLYLMRNNRNDAVKIGISRNPTEREKTLQSEEPDVILLWRCPAYKDHEKLFHDCFSSKRIRGEWFRLSKYDIEFVKDEQRKFALLAGIGSESEQGILFAELSYVERQEVMEVRLIYLEESRMSNEEIYRKYSKEITEAKKQLRAIDRERTEYFAKLEPA